MLCRDEQFRFEVHVATKKCFGLSMVEGVVTNVEKRASEVKLLLENSDKYMDILYMFYGIQVIDS